VAGPTRGGPGEIKSPADASGALYKLLSPSQATRYKGCLVAGGEKAWELAPTRPSLHVREAEGQQLMSDRIWHAPRAHLTITGPADPHRTRFPLTQEDLPPTPAVLPCTARARLRPQTPP